MIFEAFREVIHFWYHCILDIPFVAKIDFWEELFNDQFLRWVLGPISIISLLIQVPAYLYILYYIHEQNIK